MAVQKSVAPRAAQVQHGVEPRSDDQIFMGLKRYWREIAVVLVSIPVALFVRESFRDANEKAMDSATEIFDRVRNERDSLNRKREELAKVRDSVTEEDKKKVEVLTADIEREKVKYREVLIAFADSKEPYASFVPLYRDSSAPNEISRASEYAWAPLESRSIGDALVSEGEAIVNSRMLLDAPDANLRTKALATLREVAVSGKALNVLASLILARTADSAEEKSLALTTLQSVTTRMPEHTEALKEEIARLSPSS